MPISQPVIKYARLPLVYKPQQRILRPCFQSKEFECEIGSNEVPATHQLEEMPLAWGSSVGTAGECQPAMQTCCCAKDAAMNRRHFTDVIM